MQVFAEEERVAVSELLHKHSLVPGFMGTQALPQAVDPPIWSKLDALQKSPSFSLSYLGIQAVLCLPEVPVLSVQLLVPCGERVCPLGELALQVRNLPEGGGGGLRGEGPEFDDQGGWRSARGEGLSLKQ
jgi:hypothetical protein